MKNFIKTLLIALAAIFISMPTQAAVPAGTTMVMHEYKSVTMANGCTGTIHNTYYYTTTMHGYFPIGADYSLEVWCNGVLTEKFTFFGLPQTNPADNTVTHVDGSEYKDPNGNPYPDGQYWVDQNQTWLINDMNLQTQVANGG